MNTYISLLLVIFILPSSLLGQSVIKLNTFSICKEERVVVLMETDSFRISTTYNQFVKSCEDFIEKYQLNWDKELLQLFIDNKNHIVYAKNIIVTPMEQSRLNFRIQDLILTRNCLIRDKLKSRFLDKVLVDKYRRKNFNIIRFKSEYGTTILEIIDGVF